MGRKSSKVTEIVDVQMNEAALDNAETAGRELVVAREQQEENVRAIAAQLGYQLPADCADPDLIQRDIAANMRRSVEACLEVGRGLRVLKEACEHGQFIARLEVLGLDRVVAWKFIQAAQKFSNVSSTKHLTKAIGNQTKLFEMLVLDDEQIEELELTGQTGELKLDDIATMSVKELRAALREERAEHKANKTVLDETTQKLNQLKAKQARVKPPTPDQVGADLRGDTCKYVTEAEGLIRGSIRDGFLQLREHAEEHGGNHDEFMAGILAQLEHCITEVRNELEIKQAADGNPLPQWARGGAVTKLAAVAAD